MILPAPHPKALLSYQISCIFEPIRYNYFCFVSSLNTFPLSYTNWALRARFNSITSFFLFNSTRLFQFFSQWSSLVSSPYLYAPSQQLLYSLLSIISLKSDWMLINSSQSTGMFTIFSLLSTFKYNSNKLSQLRKPTSYV